MAKHREVKSAAGWQRVGVGVGGAAALGVAAAAQWIANCAITLTFPPLLSAFGASVPYLLYAAFAGLSFVFVLRRVPETKGVELEDMQN